MKIKDKDEPLITQAMAGTQAGVLGFGEINLDIYVRLTEGFTVSQGATAKADIEILTGGNTWNIGRTLAKLGHVTSFICTSSQNDATGKLLKTENEVNIPNIKYIPGIVTPSPRFVAVDKADAPILRAINLPNHASPTRRQLEHISNLLNQFALEKFSIIVLSSSIESSILEHTIKKASILEMSIVGAVSSTPTATKFAPLLNRIDVLILNEYEAREMASYLGIRSSENFALAEALSKYARNIVITMGDKGLTACTAAGLQFSVIPPSLHESFVNDLGAGDAFASFLIDAYLRRGVWLSDQTLAWATVGGVLACQNSRHTLEVIEHEKLIALYKHILEVNGIQT